MEKKKLVPKRRFGKFKGEWKERNFESLADIVRGASPRPIEDPKWFDKNSNVGWLRISDVTSQNGRIKYLEQKISELGQQKTRVIKDSHLLLSIAATVGKPVINYVKTGVHDGFLIFLNPMFDIEYMYQWLEMFRPKWQQYGQPGSQVNLNSDIVKKHILFIPKKEEQQKIGEFFKVLDERIANQERKVAKVKALRSAYLTELFPQEGETVPKRRFKEFKNSPPWKMSTMNKVVDVYDGTHQTPKYTDSGVMFLSVENIQTLKSNKFISQEDFERDFKISPQTGDVLMTRIGDIGTANIVESDENIAYYVTLALLKKRGLDPYFLKESIHSAPVKRELWHRTLHIAFPKKINMDEIGKVKIKYPNIEEQQKIGQFFKNLDDQITTEEKKLEKLKKMKEAYLEEMFV